MNIKILNKCIGCGACAIINPEVFEIINNKACINSMKVLECEDLCIDAAIFCPVNAIDISEY